MHTRATLPRRLHLGTAWICLWIYLCAGSGLAPAVVYALASFDSQHAVRLVEMNEAWEVVLGHDAPTVPQASETSHQHGPLAEILIAFSVSARQLPHPDHVLRFTSGTELFRLAAPVLLDGAVPVPAVAPMFLEQIPAAEEVGEFGRGVVGLSPPWLDGLRSVTLLI